MIKTHATLAILAASGVLAIAGCGSSNESSSYSAGSTTSEPAAGRYGSSPSSGSGAAAVGAAAVGAAAVGDLGTVLVDSEGLTLYYFEKDENGKSACYGACASAWPPLTTSGKPSAAGGAEASKLGTTKRTDGTLQVTYAGWPLYTYTADVKPGEDNGTDLHSFGAAWYPLHTDGKKAGE